MACDLGLRACVSKWKEGKLERRAWIGRNLSQDGCPGLLEWCQHLAPSAGSQVFVLQAGVCGGRQVVEGPGPGGLPGFPRAWDCVNPSLLALLPWAEQVMGLEPVRASWLKQACGNT